MDEAQGLKSLVEEGVLHTWLVLSSAIHTTLACSFLPGLNRPDWWKVLPASVGTQARVWGAVCSSLPSALSPGPACGVMPWNVWGEGQNGLDLAGAGASDRGWAGGAPSEERAESITAVSQLQNQEMFPR